MYLSHFNKQLELEVTTGPNYHDAHLHCLKSAGPKSIQDTQQTGPPVTEMQNCRACVFLRISIHYGVAVL